MENIGQAEWAHWNVWTLPVEWKNHLQHASTQHVLQCCYLELNYH